MKWLSVDNMVQLFGISRSGTAILQCCTFFFFFIYRIEDCLDEHWARSSDHRDIGSVKLLYVRVVYHIWSINTACFIPVGFLNEGYSLLLHCTQEIWHMHTLLQFFCWTNALRFCPDTLLCAFFLFNVTCLYNRVCVCTRVLHRNRLSISFLFWVVRVRERLESWMCYICPVLALLFKLS